MKRKILFGVPTADGVGLFMDEINGLKKMGYDCYTTRYTAVERSRSNLQLWSIGIQNVWLMLKNTYRLKPDVIYINSTIDFVGFTRDFFTLVILRLLYWGRVRVLIKSLGTTIEELNSKSFFTRHMILPVLRREVAGWLLLSKDEKRRVENMACFTADRIHIVKNIIRNDQFILSADFRGKYGVPANSKILFYAGQMISGAGVFKVVDAFATLKDKHNIFLIMAGDGRDLTELKDYIDGKFLQEHIMLTGKMDEAELAPFYANSDILVFPSSLPEAFSMGIFKGVSAGLAIVSSPMRGVVDYLQSPDNCVWVDPTSAGSVLAGIARVCGDEAFMRQMQWRNKKKSVEFDQQVVCEELDRIIISSLHENEESTTYTTLVSKN